MKRVFCLLCLFAACSSYVPTAKTALVCETVTDRCPELEEVQILEETFDSCAHFDTTQELNVHWFDNQTVWHFAGGIDAIGYSDWNGKDIYVTSFGVMAHELMHVKLGRDYGDMDSNHEIPPGPWNNASNDKIREVETMYAMGLMCGDSK